MAQCVTTGRTCFVTREWAVRAMKLAERDHVAVRHCWYCRNWHIYPSTRAVMIRASGNCHWWWHCFEHGFGDNFMSWMRTVESVAAHMRLEHRQEVK